MIINRAFVINLNHRTDRLKTITDECEKHNLHIHRIEAVDGHTIYANEPKRKRGFFGCYDSHLSLLKMLLNVRGDYFLVIEDDCVFADNFRVKLLECTEQLPSDWDMLYLGGSAIVSGSTEDYSQNLKRAKHILCTHAYIIKADSLSDLIKTAETRKWKIDILYCEYQKTHNCFIVAPELAWQKDGYSDVELRHTNNIHLRG